jgi:glucosamine--fructose-6-phosphate aminotransferase (isomerizing)
MQGLINEIREIPKRATAFVDSCHDLTLPTGCPYLGMGSSYFAALSAYYAGANIYPDMASEYVYYRASAPPKLTGVLISQSGASSEIVWALEHFETVTALTNDSTSPIASDKRTSQTVLLNAGEEHFSSTKTYINTLLALYAGLGIDASVAIHHLRTDFARMEEKGREAGRAIAERLRQSASAGIVVLGSGPNYGTACQIALVMTETTKRPFQAQTVAQYDHGPKEAADDSIVIALDAAGHDSRRLDHLISLLEHESAATIVRLHEAVVPEAVSPPLLFTQAAFAMDTLADALNVGDTFRLGGKITEAEL